MSGRQDEVMLAPDSGDGRPRRLPLARWQSRCWVLSVDCERSVHYADSVRPKTFHCGICRVRVASVFSGAIPATKPTCGPQLPMRVCSSIVSRDPSGALGSRVRAAAKDGKWAAESSTIPHQFHYAEFVGLFPRTYDLGRMPHPLRSKGWECKPTSRGINRNPPRSCASGGAGLQPCGQTGREITGFSR